ncbi:MULTISPECIES: antitoxin Xre/MbcA/ParS toxin-binding domain-containing protein [unclassified Pseudomonas]|uniref:type II RES/Xre toxin-antitoxin system antitoxin n=1 Tax=unclassified Pseudomonas TaxID=196821 RepID=UPI000CD28DE8|nr:MULTISPECIES: antitoxin Xre/MbcA/ParS toxin-binding domain-containing protein [unclassified Pseudomonas]POA28207.1 antitoxin [Pseudomonas sp. GW456-R21]POA62113.1 antitoxin [Pseudomonas sp. GW460-R15]
MDFSIKEYQPVEAVEAGIWSTIGLPLRGAKLHELVHQGLPFVFYTRVAAILGMTENQLRQHLRISSSTLARRVSAGRLSKAESDQICALVGVLNAATELFEGDLSAARQWMKSPVRGLNSRAPIDMMATRVETQTVMDLIGRLEHGVGG